MPSAICPGALDGNGLTAFHCADSGWFIAIIASTGAATILAALHALFAGTRPSKATRTEERPLTSPATAPPETPLMQSRPKAALADIIIQMPPGASLFPQFSPLVHYYTLLLPQLRRPGDSTLFEFSVSPTRADQTKPVGLAAVRVRIGPEASDWESVAHDSVSGIFQCAVTFEQLPFLLEIDVTDEAGRVLPVDIVTYTLRLTAAGGESVIESSTGPTAPLLQPLTEASTPRQRSYHRSSSQLV